MKTVNRTKFKQTGMGMIPEDWEVVSLGELSHIKTGKLDSNYSEENGIYPFFTCAPNPLKINNFAFDCEAILLAGNNANGIFHLNYYNGQFNAYQRTYIITAKDENKTNLRYLYYHLHLSLNMLRDFSQGTSTKFLTMRILDNLEIFLPPMEEQQIIAKTLSDFDDKIINNQQMNETLEAMGQVIFKHWFIDFEFLNRAHKSYKSSGGEMVYNEKLEKYIPKGWEVEKLGDAMSLLKDGSHNPPKRVNSGIKFIAGASDLKHFKINFENCSYVSKEDYDKMHKYWEIKMNDVLLTIVGTIGNVAIVEEEDLPFSLQRSIAILRSNNKINQFYLYFFLNTNLFKQFLMSYVNPTAQPGIYLGTLSSINIIIPKKEVLDSFDALAKSLIVRMQKNNREIKTLSQIRDSLLPKLMSGKMRFK